MNITYQELVQESKNFLLTNFGMEMGIPIQYNARMKSCLGRFVYKRGAERQPIKIEISEEFLKVHPKDHILDVLRHELVHYALYAQGKPYDDGHPVFENKLKELGVSRTRTYKRAGEVHKYVCEICGSEFNKKRKLGEYVKCTCSIHSSLKYLGVATIAAEESVK